jgi:hypothetical protein
MTTHTDMLERLTGNYDRSPDSNTGKLLNLPATQISEIEDVLDAVDLYKSIDVAEGYHLDQIGTNVDQPRGGVEDPAYRVLLKTKIARNISDGSVNTLIQSISAALVCDPSEVVIRDLYAEGRPAAIHVTVPTQTLSDAEISFAHFGAIINRLVAAGVAADVMLEGTFKFASGATVETDEDAGFSDLDQLTGGYFGAMYDPGTDVPLPL